MKLCNIIGIGSHFGFDQVGWKAIEFLRNEFASHPHIKLFSCHRSIFDWWDQVNQFSRVIFIDALIGDLPGDRLHRFNVSLEGEETLAPAQNREFSSHGIALVDAIRLAQRLQRLPTTVEIIGIVINHELSVSMDPYAELPPDSVEPFLKKILAPLIEDCVYTGIQHDIESENPVF